MKLDSFFLFDNTVNLMKSLLDDTKRTGSEHAFDLCINERERIIKAENFCVGNKCEVQPYQECKKGEILVGGFHTHALPFTSRPSLDDLKLGLQFGIQCIATVKDSSIKCYVKKEDIPFRKDSELIVEIDGLIKKRDEKSLTAKDFKRYMKLEDNVKKKCFRTIDISQQYNPDYL